CSLCEEVCIFLPELIFAFPCELMTSPRVPLNLDYWNAALLQLFNFTVHDFYRILDKLKLVIKVKSIQWND
ncbi:hypothetical protein Tco_0388227, partial [Tanacetum coccineum]